ncbi:D-alanyl-D-alanine carboxypeptidase/D-alanyl-D-alanine-endopeptidase [Ancylomarina euxinus]|uniref:D-alanyl-D-alanine carboxypeptidase/D-alanyl-D-alanine-endopeptidase n=1 Tax=Ancylomarina euxinus TaxID=2283627 RepID=A0A425Y5B1_9BACT|nr:D-alanyl-D-alanine carboxypeptidase/D-alanyl-D-alanine-endopeptidase [Ancylomarina euxinus]MCZ4694298.1 D-alanyl-D-alanine carboxypeptidase/D-alanyl-D-alanine-endopeptidase [Ancylomarina euxinus]MUP14371.1 D-alanyl-D-alanine carboxypeptidase/D-alanyl-D-alanine-endopeptidase [Ancylomarina euxinus]RRG23682.1 D-alanyl-D-alanine carboxypeptidase/D-alanyl-D-alanine-endopeptidase [Ancylomarina euxinus]
MTRFTLNLSFIGYLLLVCFTASAQKQSDQKIVDRFVEQAHFKSASIGIEIRDLKTGEFLAESDSEKSLTPASTQKLVTTATALEILGADFQFRTDVFITGRIDKDGVLMGNLVIKGYGDPTLASKYFPQNNRFISSIYKELKNNGISQINGKLIIDNSYFKSSIPRTWIWEDIGNYYGAVPHALSYRDNTYTLHFESKEAGTLTEIKKIDSKQNGISFSNEVLSSTINKDRAYIFGGTASEHRLIEGTIPQNRSDFKVKGASSKPEIVLLSDLRNVLYAGGIQIKEQSFKTKTQKTLVQFNSPPLSEIVAITNQKSINLFADHLLFQIGMSKKNEASWLSGLEAVKEFWQSKGIDSTSLFLFDGSGLSHFNAISAKALNQILTLMNKSENAEIFFNSLPIAGKNGTLKSFGQQSDLAGNFKAKTGSMTGVRSYSGLLTKKNGQQIAISLIINNYSCSTKLLNESLESLLIELSQH